MKKVVNTIVINSLTMTHYVSDTVSETDPDWIPENRKCIATGFVAYVLCTISRSLKTFSSVASVIILISKFYLTENLILSLP